MRDKDFKYAGFWLRSFAFIIDLFFLTVLLSILSFFVFFSVYTSTIGLLDWEFIQTAEIIAQNIIGVLVSWIYFASMESSKYGATLGKKFLGLRVVDLNGNPISFGRASSRYFGTLLPIAALILSYMLFPLLLGYFTMGWTKRKQTIYDSVTDTLVVTSNSRNLYDDATNSGITKRVTPRFTATMKQTEDDVESKSIKQFNAGEITQEELVQIIRGKQSNL